MLSCRVCKASPEQRGREATGRVSSWGHSTRVLGGVRSDFAHSASHVWCWAWDVSLASQIPGLPDTPHAVSSGGLHSTPGLKLSSSGERVNGAETDMPSPFLSAGGQMCQPGDMLRVFTSRTAASQEPPADPLPPFPQLTTLSDFCFLFLALLSYSLHMAAWTQALVTDCSALGRLQW